MLVLFETAAGYAIFKLLDENKIKKSDDLYNDFETPEGASQVVKLKHFEKFTNTTEALAATTAAVEGKLSKKLKKALKKVTGDVQDQLLVADAKLGNAIKDKLNLSCISNTAVNELIRCIRMQTEALLAGCNKKDMTAMSLGLAHSLSRYKLKFSPDKVDTMIVQAICLLDELDKELNNYVMRCREWYGWHFPELGKIITDNIAFVKTIRLIGTRDNVSSSDLSDILPDEIEEQVKAAAETSMGTEIADDDILNIQELCDQVTEISAYRSELYDYLKARMMAIAPNLTVLLGELVGARLIAHAGSLLNLAKHPASTVQIIGAEKALFRALKTKKDTPKYGLIYHSQLVGQASNKNKGKMSRMLAAKASLATRVDALGEGTPSIDLGTEHRTKLEARLRILEEGSLRRISGTARAKSKFEKYHGTSDVKQYMVSGDSTIEPRKRKHSDSFSIKKENEEDKKPVLIQDVTPSLDEPSTSDSPPKKKKKKIKSEEGGFEEVQVKHEEEDEEEEKSPSEGVEAEALTKKKKKKKKRQVEEEEEAGAISRDASSDAEQQFKTEDVKKKKKKQSK